MLPLPRRGVGKHNGRLIVLYPDEVHDGHAGAPTGFVYSMLYVDPSLIAAALGGRALPFCDEPVFDDHALRRVLANVFVDFPQPIEDLALPPSSPRSPRPSRAMRATTSSNARLPERPRYRPRLAPRRLRFSRCRDPGGRNRGRPLHPRASSALASVPRLIAT